MNTSSLILNNPYLYLLAMDASNWVLIFGVLFLAFYALSIVIRLVISLIRVVQSTGIVRSTYLTSAIVLFTLVASFLIEELPFSNIVKVVTAWIALPIVFIAGTINLVLTYKAQHGDLLLPLALQRKQSNSKQESYEKAKADDLSRS